MNVRAVNVSLLTCTLFVVFATGCATSDTVRVKAWQEIRTQEVAAEKAKWDALAALGKDADNHTKDKLAMAWMAASMGGKAHEATPMPAEPETAFDKTLRAISIIAPVASSITGNVMAYKLGTNQAQYARDVALGDQRARVDTVTAVATGMGTLGSNGFAAIRDTAGYGLSVASSLGLKPTTVVNGNGNAVNGSATDNSVNTTTTTTSTNNCTGGGSGSTTSTTGNPAGAPGGSAPCTISK